MGKWDNKPGCLRQAAETVQTVLQKRTLKPSIFANNSLMIKASHHWHIFNRKIVFKPQVHVQKLPKHRMA